MGDWYTEDAYADALVELVERGLSSVRNPGGWLRIAARHNTLHERKRFVREGRALAESVLGDDAPVAGFLPSKAAVRKEKDRLRYHTSERRREQQRAAARKAYDKEKNRLRVAAWRARKKAE